MRLKSVRNHPLASVWGGMKQRCNNPNNKQYHNYGGSGVSVCEEWNSLRLFILWAESNGWIKGLTIDRINPKGNYEPNNCRFLTRAENNRNKTNNKLNWDKVKEIRIGCEGGLPQSFFVKKFKIHHSTISNVITRKTWNG